MSIEALIQLARKMLTGKEGVDFSYLETPLDDPEWWYQFRERHKN